MNPVNRKQNNYEKHFDLTVSNKMPLSLVSQERHFDL